MTSMCIFASNLNKPILEYQKTEGKKRNIITRIYCSELIFFSRKQKKKQSSKSSKVTNFMRMVGNMSSSVDYRVITIWDALGAENGRVPMKKSHQHREKEQRYTIIPHGEREERRVKRGKIFIPSTAGGNVLWKIIVLYLPWIVLNMLVVPQRLSSLTIHWKRSVWNREANSMRRMAIRKQNEQDSGYHE